MRHPTDGTLRRLLDEPAGVADADREHVAGCPVCRSELAAAREDAATAGAALNADVAVDVDAGWSRLSREVTADGHRRLPSAAPVSRWRALRRSPVVAWFAVVALLTGATAAAAADWLPIFRTEQIAPVTITRADLVALPDLSAYGDVTVSEEAAGDGCSVSPDVADTVVTLDERRRVRAALARLPHRQAVALVLRHSGLSYAEVAAALDLSPGSVGTVVRRAESALRKELIRHESSD